ncbi:MAG: hypothetical protein HZB80_09785 [Deltaproteobacteria bacterium]|nr:hypothetical protein [Deltaproteobacteria bacterium]
MKKLLYIAVAAVALAFSGTSFAATTIQQWAGDAENSYACSQLGATSACGAAGGIVWTRHNLSSYGEHYQASKTTNTTLTSIANAETTEVCVFCHTPHHGRTDTAPLWNKTAYSGSYTAYGTTIAGTGISSVGGSSLACLSCHDGVSTLDAMINKPGKGTGTATYAFLDKAGTTLVGTGDSPTINSGRLNLGTTLANDHPISVTYSASAASLRATSTTISSITINQAQVFDGGGSNYGRSDNLWAVKGFVSSTATIADLLRDSGQVQCSSCHDPHYKNQTNDDPAVVESYGAGYDITHVDIDGLFLRRVGGNSNSGVCRTCHNK